MPRLFVVRHGGYPFDVLVAVNCKARKIRKRLAKLGCKLSASDAALLKMRGRGRAIMFASGQSVIRLAAFNATDPESWAALSHETFHAVTMLMHRVGIPHGRKSDEAYAYAVGGLMESIARELLK